jgi:tetratricopeptide (TPR) repeat protein
VARPRASYSGDVARPSALERFVNRGEHIGRFTDEALAIGEETHQVLTFHGMGGQGKTLLRQKFESLLQDDPSLRDIRWGVVDLHELKEREPIYLLLWIRNALLRTGRVKLPSFDLAFELYWRETHANRPLPQMEQRWLGAATGLQEVGVDQAVEIAQEGFKALAEGVPFVGFFLKRAGGWAIRSGYEHYHFHTNETLKHLFRNGELISPAEIEERLPYILGRDLERWRQSHPKDRFLVLMDEYETAFDYGGASAMILENRLDKLVRDTVASCPATLFVFFSREPLPWAAADPDWGPVLDGRQGSVAGLKREDAQETLTLAGIADPLVQAAIIEAATVDEDEAPSAQAYPFMLDLAIRHWEQLRLNSEAPAAEHFQLSGKSFTARRNEMVGRLLRSYGRPDLVATLPRLAVARVIDQDVFDLLVERFGTRMPLDDWPVLAHLSLFAGRSKGNLRLHNLAREGLVARLDASSLSETHQALHDFFVGRMAAGAARFLDVANAEAAVEAFHHLSAIDKRGALFWWDQLRVQYHGAGLHRVVESVDRTCIDLAADCFGELSDWSAASISYFACSLDRQGRHAEAESLHRRALEIFDAALGPTHRDTATSLSNLALNLDHQGRHPEAESLHRRALEIVEAALGSMHPDTAATLNNLASNLHHQGRHAEAAELQRRVLDISEAALGPVHRNTAASLNNLASNLDAQGRHAEAEDLHRRAVQICEATLGPMHRSTAVSLGNLATSLDAQGRHAEAEELNRRALEILEAALGPMHRDTAVSLSKLASNLDAQGRHAEAEELNRRDLAISKATLGPTHPDTATSLGNLGLNLDHQGRHGEAESLHRCALHVFEAALGPMAPDTAASLGNLGLNLDHQGCHADAESLHRRALEIFEATVGPMHRDTAASLNNLASNLDAQGHHAEAETLHRRALEIRDAALGPMHRDTAASLCNLGSNLDAQGRHAEAETLHRRALEIREAALGPMHRDTAASLCNLGSNLDYKGRHVAAEELHRRALETFETALGPMHPRTARARFCWARHLSKVGRIREAREILRAAYSVLVASSGPEHAWTHEAATLMADCCESNS